ncbi:MAG: branched-chain amino acid transport system substrate-binding protein [Clostridiales bacterium]|nr:branched-chain amino acid transport system substrate-binding protein [Clostridiales bacterium]
MRNKSKILFGVMLLLVVLVVVVFVFIWYHRKPILIGYSSNLTGTSSEIAVEGMYGAMMAVQEVNKSGGIKGREIKLIIKDDGNTEKTALEADKELVSQGVKAIIGHSISGVFGLSFSYINSIGMVMVSPSISSSDFAHQNDYFYTMVPISEYQSERISQALTDYHYKKTGYLYQKENERYSKGFVEDTAKYLKKQNLNPTFMEYYSQKDEDSFQKAANLIVNSEIDSLVISGPAYDVARFAQILYSKHIKLPIFTSTWSMSTELLSIAGPAAEGIFTINSYDSASDTSDYKEFYRKYKELYNEEPTFSSVYSYEGCMLLLKALKESAGFDGVDIKAAIESNSSFVGLQGDVSLDENGDAHRNMYLFEVVNGEFERVD